MDVPVSSQDSDVWLATRPRVNLGLGRAPWKRRRMCVAAPIRANPSRISVDGVGVQPICAVCCQSTISEWYRRCPRIVFAGELTPFKPRTKGNRRARKDRRMGIRLGVRICGPRSGNGNCRRCSKTESQSLLRGSSLDQCQ
jgi:hypothetical protein